MIDKLTPKQQQLANLMSDISEECYYAGWMTGLENYTGLHCAINPNFKGLQFVDIF